ncbi:MAG TPA: tRNA lysidine(34) synthetase TilS, partial [Acetobacteraceae bacterium]
AIAAAEFSAAMAPLGPFEPAPSLAVAVSGGADSMALAVLAADWAAGRGGQVIALVVDHGLRAESRMEAELSRARLDALGIPSELLVLTKLRAGPGLAARARTARHEVLRAACARRGIVHLLLGHHAADQAETIAMRMLARTGPAGLAGMAALVEVEAVRLLRPLLPMPPVRLRSTLRARGIAWVEDPSNQNPAAQRVRLRALRGDADGAGPVTRAMVEAASWRGRQRAETEWAIADVLARRARIHGEGYAVLSPGPIDPGALAALVAMLAGAARPPSLRQTARLAARPEPATLGGVQISPAGRLGEGWLLAREPAAMAPAMPARPSAVWDGRFRLEGAGTLPAGLMLGALGSDAGRLRDGQNLPSVVLQGLPALRLHGTLVAVPHLRYRCDDTVAEVGLVFHPRLQAASAGFLAAGGGDVVLDK